MTKYLILGKSGALITLPESFIYRVKDFAIVLVKRNWLNQPVKVTIH